MRPAHRQACGKEEKTRGLHVVQQAQAVTHYDTHWEMGALVLEALWEKETMRWPAKQVADVCIHGYTSIVYVYSYGILFWFSLRRGDKLSFDTKEHGRHR